MSLSPILIQAANPANRDALLAALTPLGRDVLVMEDAPALMAELAARQYLDGAALLVIDTDADDADFYPELNRLLVDPTGAHLPIIWLAAGTAGDHRRLYSELLQGIEVIYKPCLAETLRARASFCLEQDDWRRSIQQLSAGADWDQTLREGLLGLAQDGRILYANRSALRMLRLPARRLMALFWQSLIDIPPVAVHPKEFPALAEALAKHDAIDIKRCELGRGDGSRMVSQAAIVPVECGNLKILFAFRDITERGGHTAPVADMASLDLLTGLPARSIFEQAIGAALKRAGANPAVLVMDIDHLRHINETLGYELGDQLLQAGSRRLREVTQGEGMLARVGGDRFATMIERVADFREAGRLAQRLNAQFREPFLLAGHEIFCGLSVGVALFPGSGDSADALLRSAEVALDRAKSIGRNTVQFYSAELNRHSLEQLERETALHHVLSQAELLVRFEPWQAANGQLTALRVALDWQPPARFGKTAEEIADESGLACALSWRLLHTALARSDWPRPFPAQMRLMFSLPATCLRDHNLLDRFKGLLARHGWDARHLQLNLSLGGDDWAWLESPLAQLNRLGVQLGLSLGRHGPALEPLCRLPWQCLVLEPVLTEQVLHDRRVAEAVASLVEFGHRLHLGVMAGGVAAEALAEFLFARQVDACAGAALSEMVAADGIAQWVAKWMAQGPGAGAGLAH